MGRVRVRKVRVRKFRINSREDPGLTRTVEHIRSVKAQGAKHIAVHALRFLRGFCKRKGFGLKFEVAAKVLEDARPTAVVLHNCIEAIKKERKLKTIDGLLRRLDAATETVGRNGARLVGDGYTIMTHCHSGEALAVIKRAWKDGKRIAVIATETDPLEQGVKTAKELASMRIPVTLITDSAVGFFMPEVDCVIVGTDAIRAAPRHAFVNKVGTLNLALAAREFRKRFYVAGSTFKLDRRKKLYIEERPAAEVYAELLRPGDLKGVKLRNPAFDVVPFKLVTKFVTERGVLSPAGMKRLLGKSK
ncbi:MAG: S-methyl-5-thioribose-1-phosphate isomerase [Candidatus Aenigmatarchaeota archaeon]